jgi:pimeloyl-ACP methyl ester carboxylesterase
MSIRKPILSARVHNYLPNLVAVEHLYQNTVHPNIVLFIGGLGNGIHDVPYTQFFAERLNKVGWGFVELLTSSSYIGWGTGSLKRDTDEVSKAVEYFRSNEGDSRGKIVLMGHSTGCQDSIYYLVRAKNQQPVDGAILQASASDREAYITLSGEKEWREMVEKLQKWVQSNDPTDVLPKTFTKNFFQAPISAERLLSLLVVEGDDDFFSSDISADELQTTFGRVDVPLLVLYSEKDQFVPKFVDKEALLARWKTATDARYWDENSGLIKGGSHALDLEGSTRGDVWQVLADKVERYLSRVH